ncbi:MAG: YraN family protein, partial [Deltaproteobacteria bacterium]
MRGKSKRSLGLEAEDAACRFLQEKGFQLIERNVRSLSGEIDVLARDGRTLVVVEVRRRSAPSVVSTGELVPPAKRRKIVQVAREVVGKYMRPGDSLRFDVVVVTDEGGALSCLHIESAFG